MSPVLIAHLLLSFKKVFPARFSDHTHKKFSTVITEITPPTPDFLGTKGCKATWTWASEEKETKAIGDLGNSFHFPLSPLLPSIPYPNKDFQLKNLNPSQESIQTPLSARTVPARRSPSAARAKRHSQAHRGSASPRHSPAPAWLCTGWNFPRPKSSGCGNQSQSSRINLLASFFICTRSESSTAVYGVIKLDFIWICRDSHLFPHSLFALIAALTQRYSSIYQFKQNFKHCLNVSKCIQKCNEVPLPPTGCVYCP